MHEPAEPYWMRIARHGLRYARRVVIAVIGSTVVLIGILMIFTPGPGMIVIPAGLAILATEFVWAQRLLKRTKEYVAKTKASLRRNPAKEAPTQTAPSPKPD